MKKFYHIITLTIITAFGLASAEGGLVQLDGIAAEVGGKYLTRSDVIQEAREAAFSKGRTDFLSSPGLLKAFYSAALTNLVNRTLVLLEYEKGDAKIPEWYFNQRIERIIETSFGGDKSKLITALDARGLTYDNWRQRTIDDMVVATMRQQFIDSTIVLSPNEIEEKYKRDYADKKLSGHTSLSMIMLNGAEDMAKANALADEIVAKLEKGADFAELAKKHSQEQHAPQGGLWGYIEPEDELRTELAKAIVPMGIGKVVGPITVGSYIYILKKNDEREDLTMPFEVARDEIERELMKNKIDARYKKWIALLSTKWTVRIFPFQ